MVKRKDNLTDYAKINNQINDAIILIRTYSQGILQSELRKLLSISENEFNQLIPKILMFKEISSEDLIRKGTTVNKILKSNRQIGKTNYDVSNKIVTKLENNSEDHKKIETAFLKYQEVIKKQKDQIKNTIEKQIVTKNKHSYLKNDLNKEYKIKLEEEFMESQKEMENILRGKNELEEMFMKLNEKLKQINPNAIRNISEKV